MAPMASRNHSTKKERTILVLGVVLTSLYDLLLTSFVSVWSCKSSTWLREYIGVQQRGTRIESCATSIDSCATRIGSCGTRIDSCATESILVPQESILVPQDCTPMYSRSHVEPLQLQTDTNEVTKNRAEVLGPPPELEICALSFWNDRGLPLAPSDSVLFEKLMCFNSRTLFFHQVGGIWSDLGIYTTVWKLLSRSSDLERLYF